MLGCCWTVSALSGSDVMFSRVRQPADDGQVTRAAAKRYGRDNSPPDSGKGRDRGWERDWQSARHQFAFRALGEVIGERSFVRLFFNVVASAMTREPLRH
jgi:hypothetical protein